MESRPPEPLELRSLTTKLKRLKDWSDFVERESPNERLRLETTDTLKRFRNVLAKCWEAGTILPEDEVNIRDLERQLEALNEAARLLAGHQ